jgi:hypothetical protein
LILQRVGNEDFAANQHRDDRSYLTGDAGLEWKMSERAVLTFTAGYSQARLASFDERAIAWRSALGIRWTPNPWSASR